MCKAIIVKGVFQRKAIPTLLAVFITCLSLNLYAQENCANGIDDDGDGWVDLNDTEDCTCQGIGDELENLIPNPSFEDYIDCPTWFSQMQNAESWNQATLTTSDYFNACGMMWESVPQPLPDGDGCVGTVMCTYLDDPIDSGDYFEYVGVCLESPLETGQSYQLQFSIAANNAGPLGPETFSPIIAGPVDVTIYGFETCGTMPVPTQTCPVSEGWYVLGTVTYQPENVWSVQTITMVPPENTAAIMIGAPCEIDDENYDLTGAEPYDSWMYFYYDDLHLNTTLFPNALTQTVGPCQGDLILGSEPSDILNFQWYHEGVALAGETSYSLNLGESGYALGTYQLVLSHPLNGSCHTLETQVSSASDYNPIDFEADVTSGCAPLEVSFDNTSDAVFMQNPMWNFGINTSSELNPVCTFDQPGLYSVTLTGETVDGCVESITIENYIEVFANPTASITYEVIEECDPFVVSFHSDAPAEVNLNWDFGQLGGSAVAEPLWTFDQPGSYEVVLTYLDSVTGCTALGTVGVELAASAPPSFELLAPEFICENNAVDSIEAVYENGNITWLEGDTGRYLFIDSPGWYHAVYTNSAGCQAVDSVYVASKSPPKIYAEDKKACEGNAVQLFAESDAPEVYWENISNHRFAEVKEEGWHVAVAENECGATRLEVLVEWMDCGCQIYIPNAFTPNGDGVNDLFKPVFDCELGYYELRIWDRWGQEVFATDNPHQSWNGGSITDQQYSTENGIYQYMLIYDNALKPLTDRQTETGFIQLLR